MKIAYICPGTGGAFYCENCVRDHALVSGLRALGHDVGIIPMYLPFNKNDAPHADVAPVMFGAVRLYLIDKMPSLRKVPDVLLKSLDSRCILNMAAGFAGSTRAGGHEEMTVNMVMGEEGPYADEFGKLADYLIALKSDIVFLPNALMLGIASAVKAKSPSIKTVCILQDEHIWIDASSADYRDRTWDIVAKKSRSADMLCAHSVWYKDKFAEQTQVPPSAISTIPLGVDPAKYSRAHDAPPSFHLSIGYLSRLCRDMGMDALAEAYCRLLRSGVCGETSSLGFCGGYTKDDGAAVNESSKKIAKAGGRIRIRKRFDMESRSEFLSSLSVLSVPARVSIAFGGFIPEAMAAGVPAVQPDGGGFSEVISETGAGLLYSPNTPEALADALEKAIRDADGRKSMAEAGLRAVRDKYNHVEMARRALAFLD